jgi:hypothetical protein
MRLMTDADSPDDLWSACKRAHAVLFDNLSTAACFGNVSKPAATRVSLISAILADCRAFILDKHDAELTFVLPRLIFETPRSPITGTHQVCGVRYQHPSHWRVSNNISTRTSPI